MKMPRPLYPLHLLVPSRPDIFGLRVLSFVASAGENESERQKRVAKIEKVLKDTFRAAARHVGEEEARRLFERIIQKQKRGRGKALAPDRDSRLLAEYDAAVTKNETVATLARRLHSGGKSLGNTPGAIAAQIRKLLKARKDRDRAAALNERRLRMAMRHSRNTILGAAKSEK
jgi:hypothetical protein